MLISQNFSNPRLTIDKSLPFLLIQQKFSVIITWKIIIRPIVYNSRFNFFEILSNSQGNQMKVRQPCFYYTYTLKIARHIS